MLWKGTVFKNKKAIETQPYSSPKIILGPKQGQ